MRILLLLTVALLAIMNFSSHSTKALDPEFDLLIRNGRVIDGSHYPG